MNLADLHRKLIAAARLQKPDDRVPYVFEKRVMALIADRAARARQILWVRGLWRAAVSCVAVAIVAGTVVWFSPETKDNGTDLSQDFENTLLASVDQGDNTP
jgi:hypothetical protein